MRIAFRKTDQHPTVPFAWAGSLVEIVADLEADDSKTAQSTNSGRHEITLTSTAVRFALPVHIRRPHPDLIGLIALKLFSPYIGGNLTLEEPVSRDFATAAVSHYKRLKTITSSFDTPRRSVGGPRPALSFSGGADSVATASVMPTDTALIQLARMDHPALPGFEPWYKTMANIKTLEAMPKSYPKYTVFSDMEFLSTNGRWCVYPDGYAFTLPTLLLADTLGLSDVVTGAIWAAPTGDETIFTPSFGLKRTGLFEAAGLPLEGPCNGIGELSSLRLADGLIGAASCTTCQYGEFQRPCMRCVKCLRKGLMVDALTGSQTVLDNLARLNGGPAIQGLAKAEGRPATKFAVSHKWCAERVPYVEKLDGPVRAIVDRALKLGLDVSFADACYEPAYGADRPGFVKAAKAKISQQIRPMTEPEIAQFSQLDWRKNGLL